MANTDNDHQKTVSGKNQHRPDDKVGYDAGGSGGGQDNRQNPLSRSGSF